MCVVKGISFVGKKYELVVKLVEGKDVDRNVFMYDGILSNVFFCVS